MPLKIVSDARAVGIAVVLSMLLLLAACSKAPPQVPGEMKVPVSVVTVQPQRVDIYDELPGRVDAIEDAEIRARVNGVVTRIDFDQGSRVKEGQLLFTIDPAPYIAARDQAAAQLKQAQANVLSAHSLAERYARLVKVNAVSRQDYDNAVAQNGQAVAAVAAAKAALETARINLGYTKVVSPIDGRTGKALVTVGALVSASAATQLATVQRIDRVYVDLTRSTVELLKLRRALANGQLTSSAGGAAKAVAILEDGSRYAHEGKLLFAGISVDPTTGQVNLRAEFPNPEGLLLPGMYVRVELEQGVNDAALMVPRQAVQRSADGLSTLMLVDDGKVAPRAVELGQAVHGQWIVTKGLKAGDVVIVAGFQKIRPGAPVAPEPWNPSK
ncbi:MAG: efflux RND transporter periplasmic adaptor subunit [Candidimonas sp.]|nr:MAG: efflux RND transporter periplasmic adaptor subunit [Candidimonas sp.]